ncbi:MAG: Phenylalanine-tRNA ligase beta subunit [Candidatus Woesebacteria bacterium GW2011_GWC2_45_9]|uniref:Phenylalanine--tRNA ligase beta subunit n=1 Tax=Candidatus Woesebacteria bacterium GW2011_GWC2_45_9 TaxID=1618589 RepID=A0A0G1NBD8_9BACT|nr:MAG: Phenylalanine-tRNA ligase beta subunit [Candidatus Woesebacteria bacterium GW2011_GWC2_45_9]
MDIKIPDNWLRDFLKTKATSSEVAKYLSLSGPSVEKVEESVYFIEVTTNRVDVASIMGVAREAAAILPQFGVKARLQPIKLLNLKFSAKVDYLEAEVDHKLCSRFSAVLIKNVQIKQSPDWLKERLAAVGVRPINNVVDISNYVMHELGQPVHTFDYDKILKGKMVLRESRKGERLTTLDGKTHTLPGGDIVIEDGRGRLIDLAGIMGGENSAVDGSTKNILLFVQTYNPVNIRQTSMSLAQRTEAAVLFEKGLDPELVTLGIGRGIEFFVKLTNGRPEGQILDIYPAPYKAKKVEINTDFITARLGTEIPKGKITQILRSLGFETNWKGKTLEILVPSHRAEDISIPEDVVEEIARLYGYHNLPSELMQGALPEPPADAPFGFEEKVKNILKGYGGVEIYTFSLVTPEEAPTGLTLKNPLGKESERLRTSLMPSLLAAARQNLGEKEPFHLFEAANVYIPRSGDLPNEKMMLGGIFANSPFREAKGILEGLLSELNIGWEIVSGDAAHFLPNRHVYIKAKGKILGEFGELSQGYLYYEFDTEALRQAHREIESFKPIPKYPAQIEDMTLTFPERTKIGEVIGFVLAKEKLVSRMELTDIYKDAFGEALSSAYTFRFWYQHPTKTLGNKEAEEIRKRILAGIKEKFGGIAK